MALGAAACGGSGDETPEPAAALGPGAFALRINTYLRTGRFALAWQHLHPEQKKIVSPSTLAACWTSTSDVLGNPQVRMSVVKVHDEEWLIPGTDLKRPSKAVTVQAVLGPAEAHASVLESWTQHAFPIGSGAWAWIVAEPFIADVRNNNC